MKNQLSIYSLISILVFTSVMFFSCKKKEGPVKSVISIKGSDTMVNLAQKWAEVYMQQNTNVSIQVSGGGSGTGVAALLNGTTDIATSSRELKPKEVELAKSKNIVYEEVAVALDGLAVIVHPSNPIDNITMEEIRDVFVGKISNFKNLKGENQKINLYGRENSSGTYEFFKDHVLGKDANGNPFDYATTTQVLQGTASLAEAVAKDKNGIAYGGVGYFAHRDDVKILHVKKDKESKGISPSENKIVNYAAIWSGDYSISRSLYMYVASTNNQTVKEFISFVTSPQGQKLVEEMEYIPLPQKEN
jgi:phosphate transport system substrate-binding protein